MSRKLNGSKCQVVQQQKGIGSNTFSNIVLQALWFCSLELRNIHAIEPPLALRQLEYVVSLCVANLLLGTNTTNTIQSYRRHILDSFPGVGACMETRDVGSLLHPLSNFIFGVSASQLKPEITNRTSQPAWSRDPESLASQYQNYRQLAGPSVHLHGLLGSER